MKHFDRAERRRRLALKKAQSRKIYAGQARFANHLTECSCPACGNARRFYGPTVQERRQPSVRQELRLLRGL